MVELAGIYRRLIGARIRAEWQYRTSFVLFTIGQTLTGVLDLAAILVLFSQVHTLAGWSLSEVMFLYGTSGMAFAVSDVFVSEVERCSFHIKQGSFDQFLLRPLGALFQISTYEFALRRLGRLVQPVVVLAIALPRLHVRWTLVHVAALVMSLASGSVIFASVWVVTSSLAFWTVETQEVANSFTYGGNYVTQYPLDVMGGWVRRVVVVLPLAFVNYIPAAWLLGHRDALGLPGWTVPVTPAVAAGVALIARVVWRAAIRHYRSTGS